MAKRAPETIRLRGIRQNNLKGFDLDLPLGKLVVVTGLSGTGKSSLVFETIHAEGQRRYVETFSPYTRQFLEMMDRPRVDSIENIRPSIAIQQRNSVRTSRSTVGTMTELCDFFKVWFCHQASLYDPDTGERIDDDNAQSIWKKALDAYGPPDLANGNGTHPVLLTFAVRRPDNISWVEIVSSLTAQGYTRVILPSGAHRLDALEPTEIGDQALYVVQDRLTLERRHRSRFIDGTQAALHFGQGEIQLFDDQGRILERYSEFLHSPHSGRRYRRPVPAMFSFNSPVGACPECRGFGRIIEIDYRLVIPDPSLSLYDGAIRAFQGAVYSESRRDLIRACRSYGIPVDQPYRKLSDKQREFVIEGERDYVYSRSSAQRSWYGVRRFFNWLEDNTYKMHVRVFLSKYRAYTTCPDCHGTRLKPDALNWKWRRATLPALYGMRIADLLQRIERHHRETGRHQFDLAADAIRTRLHYLVQVGLGYLTLDRASRSLSGGETERVSLTSCLGTALVDTLFVLDEPSIGLHTRDIHRLIAILRDLTDQGNTVVVVEHDESIMAAADDIIELGPKPGARGGEIVFHGSLKEITRRSTSSLTGAYLSSEKTIPLPSQRRPVHLPKSRQGHRENKRTVSLAIGGASKHNIKNLSFKLPLRRLVCITGVSGSGKSTLLDNVLYQGLQADRGRSVEDPAAIDRIELPGEELDVVLVDQSPVSRTPRSNPAIYSETWNRVRELFAQTEGARAAGMTASSFSFNSGSGRCEACQGLGCERVEMQFMADIYVTCPVCNGRRFNPEVLEIRFQGKSVADILELNVSDAVEFFHDYPQVQARFGDLVQVGLGYLPLGQPLNTLSGGESQRLKLVKYLSRFGNKGGHALLLLDEPTTGLHRHDIRRLIGVLQQLVDADHSVVIIEHHLDIIKSADWVIEMGPEAGDEGGHIVFTGTPERLARSRFVTSPFLRAALKRPTGATVVRYPGKGQEHLRAAEDRANYSAPAPNSVKIEGAREHNLKNISLEIPHRKISVVTGISGSGKSSLAFDIVFAEGQRRFMESMSPYARQFVEQMSRPDIDRLSGIPPTVAIEQRVSHGTRKSTVATVTEVAQYLRLLYARAGVQHSPTSGEPMVTRKPGVILRRLATNLTILRRQRLSLVFLCAPLIRGRKGHHQPLANWAFEHGLTTLRIDGQFVPISQFQKLDRYREHDIEAVLTHFDLTGERTRAIRSCGTRIALAEALEEALRWGKGSCFLASPTASILSWYSTTRTDPVTGESYPDLDPKHLSWNSSRGWCPTCRGHGRIYAWMADHEGFPDSVQDMEPGSQCPDCRGDRLNIVSRAVRLPLKEGLAVSLPQLLQSTPTAMLATLANLDLDPRGRAIIRDILPEIRERLRFMGTMGLDYLTLDRATSTLSGGEAQRIRLAAQLGSNLSGILYVLDEPSIGLHAMDNARLLQSLKSLRAKGNTLLIVEHDEDTMRQADHIIDLGPGAGLHGGEMLAAGTIGEIKRNRASLTGRFLVRGLTHPQRGTYRPLPQRRQGPTAPPQVPDWLILENPRFRNLKGGRLMLPRRRLIMACGVSGAGKSTLVRDLLKPAVAYACKRDLATLSGRDFTNAGLLEGDSRTKLPFRRLVGGRGFRHIIEVDQNPIGKTPRSTPATYTGAFDVIRGFFGSLPEARMQGHTASTYSFNTRLGRCEKCKGAGRMKLVMSFMPDTYITCEECDGRRYGQELDEIRWKGKNISDVLAMTFEEAAEFFNFHVRLKATLDLMVETGLGYLTLGQSSPTLSGGEAQRLKLVSELAKGLKTMRERKLGMHPQNLYILEEPTIGLHLSDCERLIEVLHRLVDQDHTVIVIEHHLDLIAEADYVVEIGPGGGDAGGEIIYQGPVCDMLACAGSPTAPFLRRTLKRRRSNFRQRK